MLQLPPSPKFHSVLLYSQPFRFTCIYIHFFGGDRCTEWHQNDVEHQKVKDTPYIWHKYPETPNFTQFHSNASYMFVSANCWWVQYSFFLLSLFSLMHASNDGICDYNKMTYLLTQRFAISKWPWTFFTLIDEDLPFPNDPEHGWNAFSHCPPWLVQQICENYVRIVGLYVEAWNFARA